MRKPKLLEVGVRVRHAANPYLTTVGIQDALARVFEIDIGLTGEVLVHQRRERTVGPPWVLVIGWRENIFRILKAIMAQWFLARSCSGPDDP